MEYNERARKDQGVYNQAKPDKHAKRPLRQRRYEQRIITQVWNLYDQSVSS
jgi:hypothetical protein